jgi:hypothetical protein
MLGEVRVSKSDLGDTGEQLQGVMRGIAEVGDIEVVSKRRRELIEANMVIVRVFGVSGNRFLTLLSSLIELHKPNLVWIGALIAARFCHQSPHVGNPYDFRCFG